MSARGGSRAEAFPGGHIGPPLRGVEGVWEPAGIGAGRKSSPAERGGARPLRGERSKLMRPGQRRTAERLRRGREGWVGIGAEIIPKVPSNTGQSLSHGCAVPAPFTQGSLWDGGCGLPRRPCGPPRHDSPDPLSFRGQCAHWTWESVLFTMDGGSGRRGRRPLRKVYRSPSNGPMWSSAPTGGCRELPQPPGQRFERGKSSWSNSGFARCPQSAARRTRSGGLGKALPVLPLTLP